MGDVLDGSAGGLVDERYVGPVLAEAAPKRVSRSLSIDGVFVAEVHGYVWLVSAAGEVSVLLFTRRKILHVMLCCKRRLTQCM